MAAGYKSLLAFWAGGAGGVAPASVDGKRSLLAPWIGGASSPTGATGGYRSALAPWIGGASSPPAAGGTSGYRGLLGFWIGGASSFGEAAPPETITPSGGWTYYHERGRLLDKRARRLLEEEEKASKPEKSDKPVSFSIADRPGANALREYMLARKGLTDEGRRTIEAAPESELSLILAMMIAMDD